MKEKREAPFPIRPTPEVMAWLRAKAQRNDRSVNFVVNRLLETAKQREEERIV